MGGEPDRRGPCRTSERWQHHVPIQHLGNSHQDPWFSKVAEGWPVSLPANGTDVEPFGESSVTINVTPPNGTEPVMLGPSTFASQTETEQDPVSTRFRCACQPRPPSPTAWRCWMLSSTGGMPTAWVRNDGNDLSTLELSLSGLPQGWTTSGKPAWSSPRRGPGPSDFHSAVWRLGRHGTPHYGVHRSSAP